MNRVPIFVYGAGGHGKVVAEAARLQKDWEIAAYVDDAPKKQRSSMEGVPILDSHAVPRGATVALGVGGNRFRQELAERLMAQGFTLARVIHPSAILARGVILGAGTYVGPLAVVHCDAQVGRGCIINSGAVVEHGNVLGDWVHISPHATLGGDVSVGEGAQIGMGATVLPGITVGEWSVVGAGAVVVASLGANVTAVGVPARIIGPVKTDRG